MEEKRIKVLRIKSNLLIKGAEKNQFYFPIKKAYIDDELLIPEKEYWINIELDKKDKDLNKKKKYKY